MALCLFQCSPAAASATDRWVVVTNPRVESLNGNLSFGWMFVQSPAVLFAVFSVVPDSYRSCEKPFIDVREFCSTIGLNSPCRNQTPLSRVVTGALPSRVEWFLASALIHRFRTLNVEIHNYRILPTSDYHSFTWHVGASIDLLMRDIGWNVNEIPGVSLVAELQTIAPAHARTPSHDINHCLQFAVVVGTCFCVRLNNYGTSPQLTGPCTRAGNSGRPRHSGGLGRVGIQFPGSHNFHAVLFPIHSCPLT